MQSPHDDPFPYPLSPEETSNFLNIGGNRIKSRNQKLHANYYFPKFSNSSILQPYITDYFKENEKGRIGELAADITMQWLGFCKRDAKYGSGRDNGFDGVYTKPDALFISDSKYYDTTPSLANVMNKDVYAAINSRLRNIERYGSALQKQTADHIKKFLMNHPDNIYLLAYVVIPDGKVKAMANTIRLIGDTLNPLNYLASLNAQLQGLSIDVRNETPVLLTPPPFSTNPLKQVYSLLQNLGLHNEYQLVKQEDMWEPISVQSVRYPVIRLNDDDDEFFQELINKITLPEKKEEAKSTLGEISYEEHQTQIVTHLRIILGYAFNTEGLISDSLPSLIRTLSSLLNPINYQQAEMLVERIFSTQHYKTEFTEDDKAFHTHQFSAEDQLVIFESFLKSQHFPDRTQWNNYIFLYHKVYASLCSIDITPDDIEPYLSAFVESLKSHSLPELSNLFNCVKDIYDSECYADLKGQHNCEDWDLLIKALQPLSSDEREVLLSFTEHFPPSFNYGPADAINDILVPFLPSIKQLADQTLFDRTDKLLKEAFNLYSYSEGFRCKFLRSC